MEEAPDIATGDNWERHAKWWQEGFTEGADPEYEEQILPLAKALLKGYRRILDIGCGEGQIARVLAAERGAEIVGIDPTWAQISQAGCLGEGPSYLRAAAEGLPFDDGSFDAALACLVFEHIENVDAAIAEVARVLTDGGCFVLFLNHPLIQTPGSGWIDDQVLDPPEQYWRIGPYLRETVDLEEVDKGVYLPFAHRPVSRYVNALLDQDFALRRILEPRPADSFLAKASAYSEAASIPRLMVIAAVREG